MHYLHRDIIEVLSSKLADHPHSLEPQDSISTTFLSILDQLCEEKMAATMSLFLLEDALSSAAVPSRGNQFLTYILETQLPGIHFNVDDDGRLPKATMSPQMFNARRPRLVDGACEYHMIAGLQQNMERWGSDNGVMKILAEGSKGDPSPKEKEEKFNEPDDVFRGAFHSQCLKYLCENGPFLKEILEDREIVCSMLLNMADNVKVLPPADDPLPGDILNMSLWKDSLCDLIKEMKTVEEKCPSLICNSGVYVLTKSSYPAFLRALAMEISDAPVKIKFDN